MLEVLQSILSCEHSVLQCLDSMSLGSLGDSVTLTRLPLTRPYNFIIVITSSERLCILKRLPCGAERALDEQPDGETTNGIRARHNVMRCWLSLTKKRKLSEM